MILIETKTPQTSLNRSVMAEAILDTMRRNLQLSIGVVNVVRLGVGEAWRIDARDAAGEHWAAEHEDYYTAACWLAELVGFELEDG